MRNLTRDSFLVVLTVIRGHLKNISNYSMKPCSE